MSDGSTLTLTQRLVTAYMQRNVGSRAARSLSMNEDLVLLHLVAGPTTSAELCRRIGITSASMTHLVAGLDSRGLLRRVPDPSDGRRVLLYPTKAAVAGLDDAHLGGELDALIADLGAHERRVVEDFLDRAAAIMRAE